MKLWIDTEFNSFKGEFISLAVIDENDEFFYMAVRCDNPRPWVAENVIPVLGVKTSTAKEISKGLEKYLSKYDQIHVIADWPEDVQHFCAVLITGPGMRIDTPPMTFEVRRDIDSNESAVPHNALHDAFAVKMAYLSL